MPVTIPSTNEPTAIQAVLDVHDTPARELRIAPGGGGAVWIDQFVPFHCSARFPAPEFPTAMHEAAEVHATLYKRPPCAGLSCDSAILATSPKSPSQVIWSTSTRRMSR